MNSSELLQLQLAKKLECSRIGYAIGPTGPTGPSGYQKTFTFFLDFDAFNNISRIYIPPGFSTHSLLKNGGIFTADITGVLSFFGTTDITISNTTYNFPIGLSATGYSNGGYWTPSPYTVLGNANGIRWRNVANITNLNTINIVGVNPLYLNGSNTANKYFFIPGTTIADSIGWLATLSIYYL